MADIHNGTSNVYLCGEKYLNADHYADGGDPSDNENLYVGMDNDIQRCTQSPPHMDQRGLTDTMSFGSAHYAGVNMAFCDGSVHFLNYDIDPYLHRISGMRE